MRQSKTARYVKAALKLAGETFLISTVGSLFWMLLGKQVVTTYASGAWEYAGGFATFWNFFVGIAQLYLLYRLAQWIIGLIARKTAKKVDSALSDTPVYRDMRTRVASALEDERRGS